MQNSVVWIVAAILSFAAHVGLLAAAGHIPLSSSQDQQAADVTLGSGSFQSVAVESGAPSTQSQADAVAPVEDAYGAASVAAAASSDALAAKADVPDALSRNSSPEAVVTSDPAAEPQQGSASKANEADAAAAAASSDGASEVKSDEPPVTAESGAAPSVMPESAATPSEADAAPEAASPDAISELTSVEPAVTTESSAAPGVMPESSATPSQADGGVVIEARPGPANAQDELRSGSSAAVEADRVTPQDAGAGSGTQHVESPESPPATVAQDQSAEVSPPGTEVSQSQDVSSAAPVEPSANSPVSQSPAPADGKNRSQMASAAGSTAQTMSQGDLVRAFVKGYRGSGCIYARPDNVDAPRPALTGLGGNGGAIDDFLAAFRSQVGITPEMALKAVMDAQCPAVDFIRATLGDSAPDLEIVLDQTAVRDGGALIGHLNGNLRGVIQLLVIDDAGTVTDNSSYFNMGTNGNLFWIPVRVLADGRGRNQLLLALATSHPLDLHPTASADDAAKVFQDIVKQAARQGSPLRVTYAAFKVE